MRQRVARALLPALPQVYDSTCAGQSARATQA